jgi:hypothetical protein
MTMVAAIPRQHGDLVITTFGVIAVCKELCD